MISIRSLRESLRESFGSVLAEDPGFCEGLSAILRTFVPFQDSLEDLSRRVEDYLFNALYERLGPGMTLRREDGSPRRVMMSDLPMAADAALYPLFLSLRADGAHADLLRGFWMRSGSLSALRALYLRFGEFLSPGEMDLLERILRETVPPGLLEKWLRPE